MRQEVQNPAAIAHLVVIPRADRYQLVDHLDLFEVHHDRILTTDQVRAHILAVVVEIIHYVLQVRFRQPLNFGFYRVRGHVSFDAKMETKPCTNAKIPTTVVAFSSSFGSRLVRRRRLSLHVEFQKGHVQHGNSDRVALYLSLELRHDHTERRGSSRGTGHDVAHGRPLRRQNK